MGSTISYRSNGYFQGMDEFLDKIESMGFEWQRQTVPDIFSNDFAKKSFWDLFTIKRKVWFGHSFRLGGERWDLEKRRYDLYCCFSTKTEKIFEVILSMNSLNNPVDSYFLNSISLPIGLHFFKHQFSTLFSLQVCFSGEAGHFSDNLVAGKAHFSHMSEKNGIFSFQEKRESLAKSGAPSDHFFMPRRQFTCLFCGLVVVK